jgi:hypothetical protein
MDFGVIIEDVRGVSGDTVTDLDLASREKLPRAVLAVEDEQNR